MKMFINDDNVTLCLKIIIYYNIRFYKYIIVKVIIFYILNLLSQKKKKKKKKKSSKKFLVTMERDMRNLLRLQYSFIFIHLGLILTIAAILIKYVVRC